jgi:hypothetical protein
MVVPKRTEFNRTKANNNKAKRKENSKKEELKEMLKMSIIHSFERHSCARRSKFNSEALLVMNGSVVNNVFHVPP